MEESKYTKKHYKQEVKDFEKEHGKDTAYVIDEKKIPKVREKVKDPIKFK